MTALRVLTNDTITGQPIADVLLSTVEAKIDCQGSSSTTDEWVTGGGWMLGQSGTGEATFGFIAGTSDSATEPFRGHLTFKDHAANVTIHGTVIEDFTSCALGVSRFLGTDTNGNTFVVEVDDNGEPGGGSDTFSISGTDQNGQPYSNSRTLEKGNIQAHGFTCT